MAPLREIAVDSPTIPGRPPLRSVTPECPKHERSASAPGGNHWRHNPFGDAMVDCVSGPLVHRLPTVHQGLNSTLNSTLNSSLNASLFDLSKPLQLNVTRPLSPILSPAATTTTKPTLRLETTARGLDQGPPVPPKSSPTERPIERKASPVNKPPSKSNPASATTPSIARTRSPPFTAPLTTSKSMLDLRSPPAKAKGTTATIPHIRDTVQPPPEASQPVASRFRKMSAPQISTVTAESAKPVLVTITDTWKLPEGMVPEEALKRMSEHETESLYKQAIGQVEQFEVLGSRAVSSLSRELRALDERCDYLRKTYKSLRDGRQKLHVRMIHYLKSENLQFSRESLLKQSEALLELDRSIDDWILKLEQAENRRLRVRQKLLEHVAAAATLQRGAVTAPPPAPVRSGALPSLGDHGAATPPRSPVKMRAASPTPATEPEDVEQDASGRRDVHSIKIYADGQVLNLFNDIEQAMTRMCEAC